MRSLNRNDIAPIRANDRTILPDSHSEKSHTWREAGSESHGSLLITSDYEIDAMANAQDSFVDSVIGNSAALLFSVATDGNIYSESNAGVGGIWFTPGTINANHPPADVDGLREVAFGLRNTNLPRGAFE